MEGSGIGTGQGQGDGQGEGAQSLEQILASQTARAERAERELRELRERGDADRQLLSQQGFQLHEARTNERVTQLQKMGVPPAVLLRYKALRLAAYHSDGNTLQLSVADGDSGAKDVDMDPVAQAEYLLAAIPLGEPSQNVIAITTGAAKAEALALAQESAEPTELSASQKADEVERGLHPERFDAEGKRLSVEERRGGGKAA